MKRIGIVCVIAIAAAFTAQPKSAVAFIKLQNVSDYAGVWNITQGITDLLKKEFISTGRYTVIDAGIDALGLTRITVTNDENAKLALVGKERGSAFVIKGVISDFSLKGGGLLTVGIGGGVYYSADVRLTMTAVRVADGIAKTYEAKGSIQRADIGLSMTGGPTVQDNVDGGSYLDRLSYIKFASDVFFTTVIGEATATCMSDAVVQFNTLFAAAPVALDAKILAIEEDYIYINLGSDDGVQAGYTLAVYRPGAEVKDEKTGVVLGRTDIDVATVEIVEVKAAHFSKAVIASRKKPILKTDALKFYGAAKKSTN